MILRAAFLTRATRAVEVGMAYGVSSITIADGISKNATPKTGRAKLVVMDPHQNAIEGWSGLGLFQIERAGFSDIVEFHEQSSQECLPALLARGERFDLAFIDGWHTFDHTMVDFFFIDLRLETGGVVVFDDIGYPAIREVVRFIIANRSYDLIDIEPVVGLEVPPSLRFRRWFKRAIQPIARTDRDADPRHDAMFRKLESAQAVALRKTGDDSRRFDHFRAF